MLVEVITFSTLIIGAVSGLYTLHVNNQVFEDFRTRDIWNLRIDSLLYVLVVFSTTFCVLDIALRSLWLSTENWTAVADSWRNAFAVVHIWSAILSTGLHLITNKLLQQREFMQACKLTITAVKCPVPITHYAVKSTKESEQAY